MNKRNYSRIYQDKKGFTIIEVTIVLVILVVGLLGIASMQVTIMAQDSISRARPPKSKR